jgi:hypothetical protein
MTRINNHDAIRLVPRQVQSSPNTNNVHSVSKFIAVPEHLGKLLARPFRQSITTKEDASL